MPLYEYYCPKCADSYELLRPMARSEEPGTCPLGHRGGARTLSLVAPAVSGAGEARSAAGGCACGSGGCGCSH